MRHPSRATALSLLVIVITFAACGKGSLRDGVTEQNEQHEIAEFLAGHGVPTTSALYAQTQKPFYRHYQSQMQTLSEQIFYRHVAKIQEWQKNDNFKPSARTAIYLLSGADVPNLVSFFPDCRDYLMVALQPVAAIRNLTQLNDYELQRSLDELRGIMQDIAARNYFRSAVLRKAQKNSGLPGVAPILLAFLSLMQKDVIAFENVALAIDGSLQKNSTNTFANGFRIYFRDRGDRELRTLVYLSTHIHPNFYDDYKPEGKLLASFGRTNLLLKAAVYLFHEPAYAQLAQSLLRQSELVVQDDSGIPLRFFTANEWQILPFGRYERTARLNDLKNYPLQKDLYDLYKQGTRPLGFAFGYGAWGGHSNLILARRVRRALTRTETTIRAADRFRRRA